MAGHNTNNNSTKKTKKTNKTKHIIQITHSNISLCRLKRPNMSSPEGFKGSREKVNEF